MMNYPFTEREGQDKPRKRFLAKSDEFYLCNQNKKIGQGQGLDKIFVKVTHENCQKIAVFGIKLIIGTSGID